MDINKDLFYYLLETIDLNHHNQLSYEQLRNLTVNQFSDISDESFQYHFDYLKEHYYISYFNTLHNNETLIHDLGLTFYGQSTLKKHHGINQP